MNASITDPLHPSILYYDSDYPSAFFSTYPENFDALVIQQGIADDVAKYQKLTEQYGRTVLELCCGTGRIAIPLVMSGCNLTAVDISSPLLKRFQSKIEEIDNFPHKRLTIVKQDVSKLNLAKTDFDIVICAFNSLLCIPDFELQLQTLCGAARHLKTNGILALDIWNPLALNLHREEPPESYYTRKRIDNGNVYTRFAGTGPMNVKQVQPVYGWYDEILGDGKVKRTSYTMEWRIIFRYEIELMLQKAGFQTKNVFGGNHDEVFQNSSQKMFIEAIKI